MAKPFQLYSCRACFHYVLTYRGHTALGALLFDCRCPMQRGRAHSCNNLLGAAGCMFC